MSPRSRSTLLVVLLLSACGCRSVPVPEYYENFCVNHRGAEAFTVLVVRVQIQGVLDRSYRFSISRERHELRQDSTGGYPMEACGGGVSGISADNPFNGSGYNGYVSPSATDKGVTVDFSFSWTHKDASHGSTKADQFFAWQTPVRRQVADGVLLSGWFEPPKKEPAGAGPT